MYNSPSCKKKISLKPFSQLSLNTYLIQSTPHPLTLNMWFDNECKILHKHTYFIMQHNLSRAKEI